jgi:hypothetical protein
LDHQFVGLSEYPYSYRRIRNQARAQAGRAAFLANTVTLIVHRSARLVWAGVVTGLDRQVRVMLHVMRFM